jgi:hypothetical protein
MKKNKKKNRESRLSMSRRKQIRPIEVEYGTTYE